jgi:hypothetical protein
MTGPTIADFPALGFVPAAGDAEAAIALSDKLAKAVASLQEGYQLINELANSDSADWQGSAAQEFRSHLSGDLPKALLNAHDSMAKAQSALSAWGPALESMQGVAKNYEYQAEEAKAALQQAQNNYEQAQQNPNLSAFTSIEINLTPQQIQAAGDARAQLLQCESQLQEYQSQLEAIIKQAEELEQGHNQQAGQVAEQLHSAPNGLAPHRPGMFHRAMGWLHSHAKVIGNVLSAMSAVAGVLALIPPLTVVCAPLAAGLSLAAFGMQAWGGDHNLVDLGGDLLGAVPGIGVLGDAFKGAKAAEEGANLAVDAAKAGGLGSKLLSPMKSAFGAAKDFAQPAFTAAKDFAQPTIDAVSGRVAPWLSKYNDFVQPAETAAGRVQQGGLVANFTAHLITSAPGVSNVINDTATVTKALSTGIAVVMKGHKIDTDITKAVQGA